MTPSDIEAIRKRGHDADCYFYEPQSAGRCDCGWPDKLNLLTYIAELKLKVSEAREKALEDVAHYFQREHMRHAQERLGEYVLDGNDVAGIARALKTPKEVKAI